MNGIGPISGVPTHELDYVEITSSVNITSTDRSTGNLVVAGNAVTYDGSTTVMIDFFSDAVAPIPTAAAYMRILLFDNGSEIGQIGFIQNPAAANGVRAAFCSRRLTPSNAAHTYSIRATTSAGTASVGAGAGGANNDVPAFIRITRA